MERAAGTEGGKKKGRGEEIDIRQDGRKRRSKYWSLIHTLQPPDTTSYLTARQVGFVYAGEDRLRGIHRNRHHRASAVASLAPSCRNKSRHG